MIADHVAHEVLQDIEGAGVSLCDLVFYLVSTELGRRHSDFSKLVECLPALLNELAALPQTEDIIMKHSVTQATSTFQSQLGHLADKKAGYHFGVGSTTASKLREYSIEKQALDIQQKAPDVWNLLSALCMCHNPRNYQRRKDKGGFKPLVDPFDAAGAQPQANESRTTSAQVPMDVDEAEGAEEGVTDTPPIPLVEDDDDAPDNLGEIEEKQLDALLSIVRSSRMSSACIILNAVIEKGRMLEHHDAAL